MRSIFNSGVRRTAILAAVALAVASVAGLRASATPIPDGAEVEFTASFITTPAPSSTFSNTVGGDGWAVAHNDGKVYTVFHHVPEIKVACLVILTGLACADYPKTVQSLDSTPHDFATSEWASLQVDTTNDTLYVWGTDTTTLRAGVVAIDLNSTASNPFKSFTALTAAGDAMLFDGNYKSGTGNGVLIGSYWYSFNHYSPSGGWTSVGDQNKLMCFDMATGDGCPGQPYVVPGLTNAWYVGYSGALTQVGSRLIVELTENNSFSAGSYYCFDTSINGVCTGTWPKASFGDSLWAGGGFPVLNSEGEKIGTCMKITDVVNYPPSNFPGNIRCIDADGENLTSQSSAVGAVINANQFGPYNVNYTVIGTRVYMPGENAFGVGGNNNSKMMCYDWATNLSCPNFPVAWSGNAQVKQLYSVGTDPTNPTCLWWMAHGGSKQIQAMDAFTAGNCGVGGSRVLMSSFVQPHSTCVPTKYSSLTITSPAPSAYSGGTVTFLNQNGTTLNSLPAQSVNSSGVIDLTSLNLSTSAGLPQMLVNLPGAESSNINMTVRWTGNYRTICDDNGQTVSYTPPAATTTTTVASGTTTTVAPRPQATTTTVGSQRPVAASSGGETVKGSTLPETGSNSTALALMAMVCLMTGVTVTSVRRLRRH